MEKLRLRPGVDQERYHPIIVKGGRKNIFGVPHDIDDLQGGFKLLFYDYMSFHL